MTNTNLNWFLSFRCCEDLQTTHSVFEVEVNIPGMVHTLKSAHIQSWEPTRFEATKVCEHSPLQSAHILHQFLMT